MLAVAQDHELDRGATKVAAGDERFCALTRAARPVAEMVRFVVGPDGDVVPDIKRKLPGRGLWIAATHEAVAEAARRNVFSRGFKREVRADAGEVLSVPVELSIEPDQLPSSTNKILFRVHSADDPSITTDADSRFIGPSVR